MKELDRLRRSKEKGTEKEKTGEATATKEMCTFLIINVSSLQLIPMNLIAYRAKYGSNRSGGDCRSRNTGYRDQHNSGSDLLQNHGQKKGAVYTPLNSLTYFSM